MFVQQTGTAFGTSTGTAAADRNSISWNSIFANGGLGIDLGGDGVTPNDALDADTGPNGLQNFPVIQGPLAVPWTGGTVSVRFTLDAEPNQQYRVEFFSSPALDPAGHGEGAKPLGSIDVQTDAAGHVQRSFALRLDPGTWLAATATTAGIGATSEFSPAVPVTGPGVVVGRYVFYNNSAFDGRDPAAGAGDDGAIAPEKRALRLWEMPSFDNVTSYHKGINGVMIDLVGLPADATLTAAGFSFRRFRIGLPRDSVWGFPPPPQQGWERAPAPSSITVRRGAGVGGSDRVTLVWPDLGRRNPASLVSYHWLEVTALVNAHTGLAAPDKFFFGNLVGETGDDASPWPNGLAVSATDLVATKAAASDQPVPMTSRFDHNRDGFVNAIDLALVRSNYGQGLKFFPPTIAWRTTQPPVVVFDAPAASALRDEPADVLA